MTPIDEELEAAYQEANARFYLEGKQTDAYRYFFWAGVEHGKLIESEKGEQINHAQEKHSIAEATEDKVFADAA